MATDVAVAALKKIVDSSEIKIRADVDLNKFWQSITTSDGYDLKSKAWIINITLETVRFFVYNSSDRIKWIWAHKVDAQPGETIEVHGGFLQGQQDNLVVYRDNRGTAYNIKKTIYIVGLVRV